jgi:hypothetical protein
MTAIPGLSEGSMKSILTFSFLFTINKPVMSMPSEIYYVGSFPLYEPIAETHRNGLFNSPIYVGKAVPSGARKGGYGLELSLRNLWKPAQTGRATSSLQTSQNHCPVS